MYNHNVPITIESLQESLRLFEKLPKFPPYYRVHPKTYIELTNLIPMTLDIDSRISLIGVKIFQDDSVPVGVILPPEGWDE
jgi:hypothetical protein